MLNKTEYNHCIETYMRKNNFEIYNKDYLLIACNIIVYNDTKYLLDICNNNVYLEARLERQDEEVELDQGAHEGHEREGLLAERGDGRQRVHGARAHARDEGGHLRHLLLAPENGRVRFESVSVRLHDPEQRRRHLLIGVH